MWLPPKELEPLDRARADVLRRAGWPINSTSCPPNITASAATAGSKLGLSPGATAGVVVGAVGGASLLAAAALLLLLRWKRGQRGGLQRGSRVEAKLAAWLGVTPSFSSCRYGSNKERSDHPSRHVPEDAAAVGGDAAAAGGDGGGYVVSPVMVQVPAGVVRPSNSSCPIDGTSCSTGAIVLVQRPALKQPQQSVLTDYDSPFAGCAYDGCRPLHQSPYQQVTASSPVATTSAGDSSVSSKLHSARSTAGSGATAATAGAVRSSLAHSGSGAGGNCSSAGSSSYVDEGSSSSSRADRLPPLPLQANKHTMLQQ